jgi:glycerol-3-phosphate O-acyltransferase
MDKKSKSNPLELLASYMEQGEIPQKIGETLASFYASYKKTVENQEELDNFFSTYIRLVKEQCQNPYPFQLYHQQIRSPFDYYAFGIDFLRPLVDLKSSRVDGNQNLEEIQQHLEKKHNVIFFANHQTEADPQAISLLLENSFSEIAKQMIFVAGMRVLTDPLAIPFSMGCNLLCIYSKRYIDNPIEQKDQKHAHNKKVMNKVRQLLKEGGKCIYVAPSGGRDRRNANGEVTIAPFDPQSIEMFYLMAKTSKTPTFFYPMTLATYEILPPPKTIQVQLGEERTTKRGGIFMSIGDEIDMEYFPGSENSNKHVRRKSRADYIWDLVENDYKHFPRGHE